MWVWRLDDLRVTGPDRGSVFERLHELLRCFWIEIEHVTHSEPELEFSVCSLCDFVSKPGVDVRTVFFCIIIIINT